MTRVPDKMSPNDTLLLVVDLQDKLLSAIHEAEGCVAQCRRLVEAAKVFGLPMLVTEQYPAGLGHTNAGLREALGSAETIEKTTFSACGEPLVERLRGLARPNVLVVGIEAHVCVQQTVLDLLRLGYAPYLCADAVSSRRPLDRDTAVARMRQAGAIVTTTESAIFELAGEADTDIFRQILKLVK